MHNLAIVTVIIPCHNRIEFLQDCLTSVAKQTYASVQVIVVDDASQEGSIEKAVASVPWRFPLPVKLLRSEIRLGPGLAREMGRQEAKGDYVAYLDSDDIWHKDFLLEQVKNLQTHPGAGMSYCIAIQFAKLPILGTEPIFYRSDEKFDQILPELTQKRHWATGGCLWTQEAVLKIGIWSKSWILEDVAYDFIAGCNEIKISHLAKVLCYARRGIKTDHVTGMEQVQFWFHCWPAYQMMIESLYLSGKILDPLLRGWMTRQLYREGVRMVSLGVPEKAEPFLHAASKIHMEFLQSHDA